MLSSTLISWPLSVYYSKKSSKMLRTSTLALSLSVLALATASQACTGTINSLSDVSTAVKCTTVNINGFTVPGGEGFSLSLLSGTTVNLSEYLAVPTMSKPLLIFLLDGNILFGNKSWAGPLFTIS